MQYLCWIELGKRKKEELPRGLAGFWLLYSVDWMAVHLLRPGTLEEETWWEKVYRSVWIHCVCDVTWRCQVVYPRAGKS